MELNPQVAYYVVRFYAHLMTDTEWKAQSHLFATAKAMDCSDETAQREALSLANDRYHQFQLTTAARILRDSADKVFFNCCPLCGELARTPSAKQCRYCGHDWHGT
jgi:hypothetical protein